MQSDGLLFCEWSGIAFFVKDEDETVETQPSIDGRNLVACIMNKMATLSYHVEQHLVILIENIFAV